jgi:hypothetical protein
MLTEAQQTSVREICQKQKVGMVNFLPDGRAHFQAFHPIKELVEKTFPAFRIVDHGITSWESRPDEMKQGFWVIAELDN